jgi:hypothetical protein
MNIQKDIVTWLKTLRGWQTELAYRTLTKQIRSTDIADILSMIKNNTSFVDKAFPNFVNAVSEKNLRLLAIESILNIESLAPRNSLDFEKDKNLIVIYGSNGSGKSGYTKLIKKAAGKQRAIDLKPNVYKPKEKDGKCTIKYTIDSTEKSEDWIMNNEPISDLSLIDIFDTSTGDGYLKGANTVTYTPNCMALFEWIVYFYAKISEKLEQEKNELIKALPSLPTEYQSTASGQLYNKLTKNCTEITLSNILVWSTENENDKSLLEKRLKEKDPAKTASEKRKQKTEIDKIVEEISQAYLLINNDSIKTINGLRDSAIAKRQISQDSAKIITENSELQGVGSQVWKALWEAARVLSIQEAYKANEYPNVN